MSLPSGSYSPASISFIDAGSERSSFRCNGKVLTAANFDAQRTLWATLIAAVNVVTLGSIIESTYGLQTLSPVAAPTNGAARELALRIKYRDNTNEQKMIAYLPTIDPLAVTYLANADARDAILLDTPAGIADLIAAFEAFAVNPEAPTHTVTVTAINIVRGFK